jgi:hypothetical protein
MPGTNWQNNWHDYCRITGRNDPKNGKVFGSFGPFRRSINGVFDTKTRDNGYVIITLRVVIITMTDKKSQNPELTDHK